MAQDGQVEGVRKQKIALVTLGGLGDAILFSPVIAAARRMCHKMEADLIYSSPLIPPFFGPDVGANHLVPVPTNHVTWHRKLNGVMCLLWRLRMSGRYDSGYFASRLAPSWRLLFQVFGRTRHCETAPNVEGIQTDLDRNVALARTLCPDASAADAFIRLPDGAMDEAERVTRGILDPGKDAFIAVYPSRNSSARDCWPCSKLAAVAAGLLKDGVAEHLVVVGGDEEGRRWDATGTACCNAVNLAGRLSIGGVAALLSKAKLVLGCDGGIMHVAGALKRPIVDVGQGLPITYLPAGEETVMVSADGTYRRTAAGVERLSSIGIESGNISVQAVTEDCRLVVGIGR